MVSAVSTSIASLSNRTSSESSSQKQPTGRTTRTYLWRTVYLRYPKGRLCRAGGRPTAIPGMAAAIEDAQAERLWLVRPTAAKRRR